MAAQPDFWGELAPDDIRTPVAIMREQAALLGAKTGNLIEARVATEAGTWSNRHGGDFKHRFLLVAPALGDYTYELFSVSHDVSIYPILSDDAPGGARLNNEEEFVRWLREKLSSSETRRIVSNLLAQIST
jgi:hypothetical protein